ncbi:MAG: hypothetical protein U9N49_01115 [Campylobacterota bacterium]|nr:hypothetical protein [Campylobacterota bacterium]
MEPNVFDTTVNKKFFDDAITEHNRNNEILNQDWGFDNYQEWGFDQESGTLFIKFADGSLVEANGQIYASFADDDNSWEWAWNNSDIDEHIANDSLRIKEYGERENIDFLTEPIIKLPDQNTATYLGAISEKINHAQGLFVGQVEEVYIFIGLKGLRRG